MPPPIHPQTVRQTLPYSEYINWIMGLGPKPAPHQAVPNRIEVVFVDVGASKDPLAAMIGLRNIEVRVMIGECYPRFKNTWYRKLSDGTWEAPIWLN